MQMLLSLSLSLSLLCVRARGKAKASCNECKLWESHPSPALYHRSPAPIITERNSRSVWSAIDDGS